MSSQLKWLSACVLLVSSSWIGATVPQKETQTVGVVQQWAPTAGTIKVDGVTFQTVKDLQVLDRRGRGLPANSVRAGMKVMVLSVGGHAVHVVVNPGHESPLDRPQR